MTRLVTRLVVVWTLVAAAPVAALLLFIALAAQPAPATPGPCPGFPETARMIIYDQNLSDLAEGRRNAPQWEFGCECQTARAAAYKGWASVIYRCPERGLYFSGLFENGSEFARARNVTFLSNGSAIVGPLVGDSRARPCDGLPQSAVLYLVAGDLRRFGEGAAPDESLAGYIGSLRSCTSDSLGVVRYAAYYWPLQNRTISAPLRRGELWEGEVVEFIANETAHVGPLRLVNIPGRGGV